MPSKTTLKRQEILDVVPTAALLPGEHEETHAGLREALLADLNPATPYQQVLAENLVTLEWEAYRYRSIRDGLIRAKFQELAEGALSTGTPEAVPNASEEDRIGAAALVGNNPHARNMARDVLMDLGLTEGTILAKAYADLLDTVEPLERHIAQTEERRRKLRADYDALKARMPVEDAVILEDDDDIAP